MLKKKMILSIGMFFVMTSFALADQAVVQMSGRSVPMGFLVILRFLGGMWLVTGAYGVYSSTTWWFGTVYKDAKPGLFWTIVLLQVLLGAIFMSGYGAFFLNLHGR